MAKIGLDATDGGSIALGGVDACKTILHPDSNAPRGPLTICPRDLAGRQSREERQPLESAGQAEVFAGEMGIERAGRAERQQKSDRKQGQQPRRGAASRWLGWCGSAGQVRG